MVNNKKLISGFNLVLFAIILLYGYGYLFLGAYFSHPNAEDLSLSVNAKNHGILYSVINVLVNYDGRYFTNILQAVNPISLGCINCYKYITLFSIILPVFCLSFFLRSISNTLKFIPSILLSSLFVLVNYAISPSIVHQVYWMSSSFVYHYSWCFYLLWVGSFFLFLKKKGKTRKHTWYILSTVFMICNMGMNEMFLALNGITIVCGFFYIFNYYRTNLIHFWSFAVNGLVAILFFVSNPGISKRFHSLNDSPIDVIPTFINSTVDFWIELIQFASYGAILLPTIILFFIHFIWDLEANKKLLRYLISIPFIALYISILAFYFPMGFQANVPVRVYTVVFFGLLLYSTLVLPWIIQVKTKDLLKTKLPKYKSTISFICLIIIAGSIIFMDNNIGLLQEEYNSGKIETFNTSNTTRYAIINETLKKSNSCWSVAVLPPLTNTPTTIYHQPDIKPNRKESYWNQAYERYFLLNEVRLIGDTLLLLEHLQNDELQ